MVFILLLFVFGVLRVVSVRVALVLVDSLLLVFVVVFG